MTRNYFDKELLKLHRELTEMGRRVDEIMSETLFALKRQDREAARRVVEGDDEIDGMENQIEQMCMNLICRQQPMAGDLRVITATLKLITDVERIADQCADIGEILIKMGEAPYANPSSTCPLCWTPPAVCLPGPSKPISPGMWNLRKPSAWTIISLTTTSPPW